ncbi:MAG: hypothetical protein QW544_01835 [Candidatus Caldarchaeum sp.]
MRLDSPLAEQLLSAPWRILFDVTRLDRLKVWEVRLNEVLAQFSQALRTYGYIDLNLCGIAILSAATIHRMKTEKLLQGDVPPKPKPKPEIDVLPPIELPFKPELMTATIHEIVTALQRALSQSAQKKSEPVPPQVQENRIVLTEFLVKIEEELERFVEKLAQTFQQTDMISFMQLVKDMSKLDAAKTFILLLFAAARRIVVLIQFDGSDDLHVLRGEAFGAGGGQQNPS